MEPAGPRALQGVPRARRRRARGLPCEQGEILQRGVPHDRHADRLPEVQPATLVGDWHCDACEPRGPRLDAILKRYSQALTIANNAWNYDVVPIDKEPEAKRRKRT